MKTKTTRPGIINWEISKKDMMLVTKIVNRAMKKYTTLDRLTVEMDIHACHLNGAPLRLQEFLQADDFNFAHDLFGISANIDRTTGQMKHCFLPRFYDSAAVRKAKAVRS